MSKRGGRGNSHWEVDLDLVKACSKGPVRKVVWLARVAKTKIDVLMRKYSNQEWFAYLLGEEQRVQDIFIPEQRAGSNFVSDVNCEEYNKLKIIGAMHSHPWKGGNHFSSHDEEFVNGNHNISLLVSKDGLSGQVRVTVPCGAMYVVPADVRLDLEIDFNRKSFLEEVEVKINKFRAQSQQVHSGYVTTTAGEVPTHHKTFPMHHEGCSCTQCQQDRRQWLRLQNRLSKKEKEEAATNQVKSPWDTLTEDTTLEGGAWICEECQKMNYVGEETAVDECAWCNSPRTEVEVTPEAEIVFDMLDLEKEIRDLESMFKVPIEDNQEMQDAVDKKYDETMDKLDEETLLDASFEIAAKFLVLIKQLYDGGTFKVQFDLFADKLAVDFAEPEDSITDELHMVVKKIEDQLSGPDPVEEEVKPLYGKIAAGKVHLVPESFVPAAKKGQHSTHEITYMCGQLMIGTDTITEDRPTNNVSDLCKHCFPPKEEEPKYGRIGVGKIHLVTGPLSYLCGQGRTETDGLFDELPTDTTPDMLCRSCQEVFSKTNVGEDSEK